MDKKKQMLKVLIVEDEPMILGLYKTLMAQKAQVICAESLKEAHDLFHDHRDEISVIAMDACVPGKKPNTLNLTRMIREDYGFKGPMVAISGREDFRKELLKAGCNYECEKRDLHKKIAEILGI